MAFHANLDPELRAALEQAPLPEMNLSTLSYEDLARYRAQIDEALGVQPVLETDVVIEDRHVPGPSGAPDVRLRIYRPAGKGGRRPALYWIHGGGMIFGRPEIDDASMVGFVERLGIVAVSVDYRLAPEHPHPAPVEDCYAGLAWTAKSAGELGIDPDRLAVGGASAGGGLAAGTVLLARDRG
ncbi:alpha/beta hydrolase, partial [Nonomuraea sp. K271]